MLNLFGVCLERLEYESRGLRCIESTSGEVRALLRVYNTNKEPGYNVH